MHRAHERQEKAGVRQSLVVHVILGRLHQRTWSKNTTMGHIRDTQDPKGLWEIIEATHLAAHDAAMNASIGTSLNSVTKRGKLQVSIKGHFDSAAGIATSRCSKETAQVIKFVKCLNEGYSECTRHILREGIEGNDRQVLRSPRERRLNGPQAAMPLRKGLVLCSPLPLQRGIPQEKNVQMTEVAGTSGKSWQGYIGGTSSANSKTQT